MDPQTLSIFSRQLAEWTTELLVEGRYPFRRVELGFTLETSLGPIAPPLVLWINRDSFMAGGLLLFPARDPQESLPAGLACAEALGLRHFVTWAPRDLHLWETGGGRPAVCRRLPAPGPGENDPERFRESLRLVLEEVKIPAVAGQVPPAELSPWYLANLCLTTCADAAAPLHQAFRLARRESPPVGGRFSPEDLALHQTALVVLRLLALEIEDRLPPAIAPEGLQRALGFAVEALPAPLAGPLEPAAWEVPLPDASAVRLHHLFRRLGQLRLSADRPRAERTVAVLLARLAAPLGGFPPLPDSFAERALVVNAGTLVAGAAAETGPAPLLALTALLRHLQGELPAIQAVDPFALGELPAPGHIAGTLAARLPPLPSERPDLAARLRLSWPHRRFPLAPAAPRWLWELLHLLGLAGAGARIDLVTPDDWLTAAWGAPLFELLREQFVLESLERRGEGVRLRLVKATGTEASTRFLGPHGGREIPWDELRQAPRSLPVLALDLHPAVFSLLAKRLLHPGAETAGDHGLARGIALFIRSAWGRHLWQVLGGQLPPTTGALPRLLQEAGFPLPAAEVLRHLQEAIADAPEPPAARIDAELAPWFGPPPAVPGAEAAAGRRSRRRPAGRSGGTDEEIRQKVFVDGVPRFPQHYLYDYYRPQLREFRFTPPLAHAGDFFGQVTLTDAEGNALIVEGEETARALILAGQSSGSPVLLPVERQLTAAVLERFLADLQHLHRELRQETYRRFADPRSAEAAIERIWRSVPLPAWPPAE